MSLLVGIFTWLGKDSYEKKDLSFQLANQDVSF